MSASSLLVVDDDPKVAHVLARALRRDYDVATETDGRRVLTRIENGERFAVILADLSMPDFSGVELYRKIRQLDPDQADRMLFVTGGAFSPESEAFMKTVKNPRILKPFEMRVLRQSIVDLLSASSPSLPHDTLEALAKKFDLEALQRDPSPTVFVDGRGLILWVNAAWVAFGAENGAVNEAILPGKNYFTAVRGDLNPWFMQVATSCLSSGGSFETDYDCSSTETKREYRMRMLPIHELGLLIVHSLRVEHAHDPELQNDVEASRYVSANGIIIMCSNCRRVKRSDEPRWDWVPSWLTNAPVPVSHGLCHVCLAFYFG
jgi:CheY-like chemotaxis protein